MGPIFELIREILQGKPVGLYTIFLVALVWGIVSVAGKYLTEFVIAIWPIKSFKAETLRLRKEIIQHIEQKELAVDYAELAIQQRDDLLTENLRLLTENTKLRKQIADREKASSSLEPFPLIVRDGSR